MKIRPHVTIGVCALNEESNIENFLDSILLQKTDTYILDAIVVYSDGSTDRTVEIVKDYIKRNPKITLRAFRDRTGKSSRLNDLYSRLDSDILVQSDADVVFSHPYVVQDVIAPLIEKECVAMTGGRPMPTNGTTFIEKAINCTFEAYDYLRGTLRGGNNIFSVDGRLLAYKKSLVKNIHIPIDMTANDAFTYFSCLSFGLTYQYVATAVVKFRSPQTIQDQIKQNTRFVSAPKRMAMNFDPKLVSGEYFVPRSTMISLQLKQFQKHPILCMSIFCINIYCKFRAKLIFKSLTAEWQMAKSTKQIYET